MSSRDGGQHPECTLWPPHPPGRAVRTGCRQGRASPQLAWKDRGAVPGNGVGIFPPQNSGFRGTAGEVGAGRTSEADTEAGVRVTSQLTAMVREGNGA